MSRLATAVALVGLLVAAPAAPAALRAQAPAAPPAKSDAHEASSGWAELDAYHAAMAAAWHPAARDNNLAPARARIAELADRAVAWSKSAPPATASAACRKAATPTALTSYAGVVNGVKLRADQGVTDAQLKTALRDVHERFHAFEGACGGEAGEAGGEHQH